MSLRYSLGYLAVPAVLSLIAFLALSSQWLFRRMEPGALTAHQSRVFNALIATLLFCYYRAVTTDPGRIPSGWKPDDDPDGGTARQRWCRKCEAYKPPRAHHCKVCRRCIPKMDHHCPWTVNCVSHITYPHFVRFVGYADAAIIYLEYLLYTRAMVVWENRDMPSYHGPTISQLVHLFLLIVINSMTLFALGILFVRAIWCLVVNTYTIEGWEIDRHHVLVRRARVMGGFLDGPDGTRVRVVRQEFPYDIGVWSNIVQGMGTANPLAWFWPFAASPTIESGLQFATNGFEDPSMSWPPPDPDRMPRKMMRFQPQPVDSHSANYSMDEIDAFRRRQRDGFGRNVRTASPIRKRQAFHKRFETAGADASSAVEDRALDDDEEGEEAWRNTEGERLADFGVDEEVEFYDEDDLPLAELIRRRGFASPGEATSTSGQLHTRFIVS